MLIRLLIASFLLLNYSNILYAYDSKKSETYSYLNKDKDHQKINLKDFVILDKSFESTLFRHLSKGDEKLIPRKNFNEDGSVTYTYRRNKFSPKMSPDQLERLINSPIDYSKYKEYILKTLVKLRELQIKVIIPRRASDNSQAGYWMPEKKTINIEFEVIRGGTINFAKVLNHELIHVVQSCKSGSYKSKPKLIGLKTNLTKEHRYHLKSDIYKNFTDHERRLEIEAYSNQSKFKLGLFLLDKYC